ncbi:hypothetical protein [Frigoriglobus tundricola]|uniref:Uncharacterized protein n=1 Tax=Frigoriglobus tundricola TaxID=2774151 RepID=A0A6M5YPP2_9BACT|nr:hypothetical protein [Frigoriglobus tundricola]QJW95390.1 hypothetical protein FTUN_2939 [Frigoriglobus tundricola]
MVDDQRRDTKQVSGKEITGRVGATLTTEHDRPEDFEEIIQ